MVGWACAASATAPPSGRPGPGEASALLLPPSTSTTCSPAGVLVRAPAELTTRACTPSADPTHNGSVAVTWRAAAALASWLPSSGPPSGSSSADQEDQWPASWVRTSMVADRASDPVCHAAPTSVKCFVVRGPESATTPRTDGSDVTTTSATCGVTGCGATAGRAMTGTARKTGMAAATPSKDRKRRKEDLRVGSEAAV